MEATPNTNQEQTKNKNDSIQSLSTEVQDLKKSVENPEVHTSFANMIWWLFSKIKDWAGKIGETGKETFTGIFKNASDIAKYWANQVQEWAKTVVEEVKNTETAKKLTTTAWSAASETVKFSQEALSSTLGMIGETFKTNINPEFITWKAKLNLEAIKNMIDINNPEESQMILASTYTRLMDNLWMANPNVIEIDHIDRELNGYTDKDGKWHEWMIKIYQDIETTYERYKDAPVSTDKLENESKVIPLSTETEMKAAA